MARKKKESSIENIPAETLKVLVNGNLVEVTNKKEIDDFHKSREESNKRISPKYEALDRGRITEETKKQLINSLGKNPELIPIIEILIGKTEIERLSGE